MKSNLKWHDYFMRITKEVSTNSTCLRRHYGAIIVKYHKILSTGYNGAASGIEECDKKGICYREEHGIPHGKDYDSNCLAVHAEANAIINANHSDMNGATIYIYGEYPDGRAVEQSGPCMGCYRMIRNAHIANIVIIENGQTNEYTVDEYGELFYGLTFK